MILKYVFFEDLWLQNVMTYIQRCYRHSHLRHEDFRNFGIIDSIVWRVLRLRMEETAYRYGGSCEYIE
jgi:hypothetical protein